MNSTPIQFTVDNDASPEESLRIPPDGDFTRKLKHSPGLAASMLQDDIRQAISKRALARRFCSIIQFASSEPGALNVLLRYGFLNLVVPVLLESSCYNVCYINTRLGFYSVNHLGIVSVHAACINKYISTLVLEFSIYGAACIQAMHQVSLCQRRRL